MSIIDEKAERLRAAGLDLGRALAPEGDAGFGGYVREYEFGRIYWHPVMGPEPHEIHGGILTAYLANGGAGTHPTTGERRFGFPLTDEEDSADGLHRVSRFEFGTLFWRDGAGALYGAIHERWKRGGGELGALGYPATERFESAAGQVQVFERGICGDAADVNSVAAFEWIGPQLANPHIHSGASALELALFRPASPSAPGSASAFVASLRTRFLLRPVNAQRDSSRDVRLTLSVGPSETLLATAASPIAERTLYDICVEGPGGIVSVVAPHALYAKQEWRSFGIAHVTDTHVSRRIDDIPARLRAARRDSSQFNNFNDNFRDFVRYANRMHFAGRLDLVLVTGDVVDYLYEENDQRAGRGNFGLFEDLLLGRSPYRERNEPVEELRVPIVTSLGNHDYRARDYPLSADVRVGPISMARLDNTSGFNLDTADAIALDPRRVRYPDPASGLPTSGETVPAIDSDTALGFVKIDDAMAHRNGYYFRRLNRGQHTLLRLGIHRVVLVDTRWDDGILATLESAVLARVFSVGSEAQMAFLGGSPTSVGVDRDGVALVERAIAEANALSIVIVGLHAPLFDIRHFRYFHYLRETEHPRISRNTLGAFAGLMYSADESNRVVPDEWDHLGTPYFAKSKGRAGAEFLNRNVADQGGQEIMDLCVGKGAARKVDLVLYGHGHQRVEFGLGYDAEKDERLYFMDHYLGNPARYYRSRAAGAAYDVHLGPANTPIPEPAMAGSVTVPPYAEPLDAATDHADWWHDHRPVLCQTAGLGPIEHRQTGANPEPTFQGIRIFEVRDDVIRRAIYVHRRQLLDPGQV
ncbi:MAG: metallophosphoesterase [Candidatus Eisenbacteria bacterium]|nr:metallophosphoesterase [Candidatus Eisenbacteria bacterium]